MSDTFYREQAARRSRRLWIVIGLATIIAIAALTSRALLQDDCTDSFDRAPRSVVSTFLEAVRTGNEPAAQACWRHLNYYALEAGCSEICLSRAYGIPFEIVAVSLDGPYTMPEGRENLLASVTIACAPGGETHTGVVMLDSIGGRRPWKHWEIIHSTFGGTIAQAWCGSD